MSEVSLSIGGRSYKVACADGEEAHIRRLGEAIDGKLRSMPQLSPQETQNLLFASLLLADELHEAKKQPTGGQEDLRGELDALHRSQAALREDLDAASRTEAELREQLATLAKERDGARAELAAARNDLATSPMADPELAPALERFAELLESCADKLEGKLASP